MKKYLLKISLSLALLAGLPAMSMAAIEIIDHRAELEISGNVTAEKIEAIRDLDVDYISSGALTHSSPILDISLKHLKPADGGGHER